MVQGCHIDKKIPSVIKTFKNSKPNNFSVLKNKSGLTVKDLIDCLGVSERTVYRWERGETLPKKGVINFLEHLVEKKYNNLNDQTTSSNFKFIDLFAGIGGLRKGFEKYGGECVFTSEWDKYAQMTYRSNFKCNHEIAGDIRKIDEKDIPSHNLLLAGFPCQPFSIAGISKKNSLGKSHGFLCKAQGTLFFEVARIIKYHQPEAFLLENVKNLIRHDQGKTFKVIIQILEEELGYEISYRVINAKSFLPQNRERIFIAGFKNKNNFDLNQLIIPAIDNGPKLDSILHEHSGNEKCEEPFTKGKYAKVNDKYTISDKLWDYLQRYAEKHKAKGNGFGYGLCKKSDVARTLSARYYKDGSEILIKQRNKNPRRLTPRECSRLMGFDNSLQSEFVIPVSDTQAYKQFGNSVAVPVIESIAEFMTPFLKESIKSEDFIELNKAA